MAISPRNIALIVAAGSGSRVGSVIPKQYMPVKGFPMVRHSVQAFAAHTGIAAVYVVIGAGQDAQAKAAIGHFDNMHFVTGGATRRESVLAGLQAIAASDGCDHVLIHDAARPFLSAIVIDRLLNALNENPGVVPALPVVDSLSRGHTTLADPVSRNNLWRVQTPQAFRFANILAAHMAWDVATEATDDAQILQKFGGAVAIVEGDEALAKFTFSEDFKDADTMGSKSPFRIRVGNGFDVHRLVPGDGVWLCGVFLPFHLKLAGHSDADVALHAITDAVLGAMAMGDIGDHFSPSDPQWKGAASDQFLKYACKLASEAGFQLGNVDVTIICETPKVGPHRRAMRQRISEIMFVEVDSISVKATTTEMLGFTGRGEGIAVQASVSFFKNTGD
jgi:2-C-methyl-D-erythritol 4-phosphate cytidylyltransferase / 2-C-methyl-D-erythritol 2,4-cyclodiphosphate synthase